jgi:DNA-binding NarL/FixJ family response regulator
MFPRWRIAFNAITGIGGGFAVINVVLASNLPVLREGMRRILGRSEDIFVIAELSEQTEIYRDDIRELTHVLVVAEPFHADELYIFVRKLRIELPLVKVVLIANFPTLHNVLAAMRAGVNSFLCSSHTIACLPVAVRSAAAGKTYVHEEISDRLSQASRSLVGALEKSSLSEREIQVFKRIAQGQKSSNIASDLGISIKTVYTHRTRIMEKTGALTVAELVQSAISKKIV